jgi:RNA polymerase sigma factor (sigma-70 family)
MDVGPGPTGTATTDLVRQAQAGDRDALDRLVALHLPLIYNIVGRALNGDDEVDDLVQDTMIGIIRGLPELREPGRFRSWAVTIAYRRLQDHYRRLYRPSFRTVLGLQTSRPETDVPDPRSDFAERTVAELALDGQRRELAEAARWLEPADRQLFSLWWQESTGELTRAELAAGVDVTPAHAAVQLQRMRERLNGSRVVLRALAARPRCSELGKLVHDWDGRIDARWRKRLARHTRDCVRCRPLGRDLVAPESLLSGLGLVAVPVTVFTKLGATPPAVGKVSALLHSFTGKAVLIGSAAAVTLGGVTYPLWKSPSPPAVDYGPHPTFSSPIQQPTPSTTSPSASATPASFIGVATADLYVAPDGDDSGSGSRKDPFATLAKAASVVEPGQTIALRGGTYRPSETTEIRTSGAQGKRITVSGYRNEKPVLDLSDLPGDQWGIQQEGGFWTVQGLEIEGAPSHAYVCDSCHDMVFRRLDSHDNTSSGLLLRGAGTSRNQVLDSDFHHGNAGLDIMFGSGDGNRVRGVRTYDNTQDGLDLGGFTSPVEIRDSWSYRNGNGFTFGGGGTVLSVAHVLTNNAAWDNSGIGFNEEDNAGQVRLTRNTAFRNGVTGFYLPTSAAVLTDNLGARNKDDVALSSSATESGNLWDAAESVLRSLDPITAEGARRRNGRLPTTRFLLAGPSHGSRMNEPG